MLNLSGWTNSPENTGDSRKTWRWILIDSAIIGGISLFTELATGPPTWMSAYKAAMAFGLAFFIQLAVERGLKRE
ncbi:MAG: hypothetical protein CEE41_04375 [Hadesarchaea archaeon B3_Hades]|nr:MAG: hypothetical protein CEE41_04375 [Hadesarchaea archaeon B3_Hades]